MTALKCPDAPEIANRAEAAHDVLAIAKGMIDWAGERGELNARALKKRVMRAVFGYLMNTSTGSAAVSSQER